MTEIRRAMSSLSGMTLVCEPKKNMGRYNLILIGCTSAFTVTERQNGTAAISVLPAVT
jgi:hypothetical protein